MLTMPGVGPVTFTTVNGVTYSDDGDGTVTLADGTTAPGFVLFCKIGMNAVINVDGPGRRPSDGVVASIDGG